MEHDVAELNACYFIRRIAEKREKKEIMVLTFIFLQGRFFSTEYE